MERDRDSILEHMPLEEIYIEDISFLEPPSEWNSEISEHEPGLPPVLIEEGKGFALLGNHRVIWRARDDGKTAIRAFVVRSGVHIEIAHKSISNCAEEALLFQGLLQSKIANNRSRLAEMLGYSRARITQVLNLLKLPEEIRRKILLTDNISEFQLRPLIKIDSGQRQLEMFHKLLSQKLTGRQMALFVQKKQAHVEEITDALSKAFEVVESTGATKQEAPTESAAHKAVESTTELEQYIDETDGYTDIRRLRKILGNFSDPEWEIRAREIGSSELDISFLRALSLLRSGLYREAVEIFETILHSSPENALAHFYLGRCFNLLGNATNAESYLRNAVELEPGDPDFLVELAIVLEKLSRVDEASAFYRKAGEIRKSAHPDHSGY